MNKDYVTIVNELLARFSIDKRISALEDCSPSMFVLLYEHMFHERIPGIERYPRTNFDHMQNMELLLLHIHRTFNADTSQIHAYKIYLEKHIPTICAIVNILQQIVQHADENSDTDSLLESANQLSDNILSQHTESPVKITGSNNSVHTEYPLKTSSNNNVNTQSPLKIGSSNSVHTQSPVEASTSTNGKRVAVSSSPRIPSLSWEAVSSISSSTSCNDSVHQQPTIPASTTASSAAPPVNNRTSPVNVNNHTNRIDMSNHNHTNRADVNNHNHTNRADMSNHNHVDPVDVNNYHTPRREMDYCIGITNSEDDIEERCQRLAHLVSQHSEHKEQKLQHLLQHFMDRKQISRSQRRESAQSSTGPRKRNAVRSKSDSLLSKYRQEYADCLSRSVDSIWQDEWLKSKQDEFSAANALRARKQEVIREKQMQDAGAMLTKSVIFARRNREEQQIKQVYKRLLELEKQKVQYEQARATQQFQEMNERHVQQREQIDTFYRSQLQMLKEQVQKQRQDRLQAEKSQRWEIDKMGREAREKRMDQLQKLRLKMLSAEEKRSFSRVFDAERIAKQLY